MQPSSLFFLRMGTANQRTSLDYTGENPRRPNETSRFSATLLLLRYTFRLSDFERWKLRPSSCPLPFVKT